MGRLVAENTKGSLKGSGHKYLAADACTITITILASSFLFFSFFSFFVTKKEDIYSAAALQWGFVPIVRTNESVALDIYISIFFIFLLIITKSKSDSA